MPHRIGDTLDQNNGTLFIFDFNNIATLLDFINIVGVGVMCVKYALKKLFILNYLYF